MADFLGERRNFVEAGYEVIPLRPLSKLPLRQGFRSRPPLIQWRGAPDNANLGLRAGGGRAFIDCDDKNKPGTFANVTNWLDGLGYKREDLPIVQTASGVGRHVYVNFAGALLGSRKELAPAIGAGDFRYGQYSYVATFPDVVEGQGDYRLLQGSITNLPRLDLRDVSTIIDVNGVTDEPSAEPRQPSYLARQLIAGVHFDQYRSASEHEFALVLSLANSGYAFEAIKAVFDANPCGGHYREKYETDRERGAYLWRTYQEALKYSRKESPTRSRLSRILELATAAPWQRTTDKNVFLAHAGIAYRVGRLEYAASVRDLALSAGVGLETASAATKRITDSHLLTIQKRSTGIVPAVYSLMADKVEHLLSTPNVRRCTTLSTHDAFRNGGGKHSSGRLGRRAGDIYELLRSDVLAIPDIAQRTGASKKTVKRALRRMQTIKDYRTGEVIEMVTNEGDCWHANIVDLDLVAAILQTYGATGRQRERFEKDRRDHAQSLELGTMAQERQA